MTCSQLLCSVHMHSAGVMCHNNVPRLAEIGNVNCASQFCSIGVSMLLTPVMRKASQWLYTVPLGSGVENYQ